MGVENSCGASGGSCAGAKLLWYATVKNRAQNENENKQLEETNVYNIKFIFFFLHQNKDSKG